MSSQLQNLSGEFNALLTQYQETYNSYLSAINSGNNSLTTVPNSAFAGQSNINTLSNSTVTACETACSSNTSCSGATFNNNLNNCTLSSGVGNIVNAPQSTSIVQEAIYYSYQLEQLNAQLISINQQIMTITKNNFNQFQQSQQQTQQQDAALKNNYQTLEQERLQIQQMVRQFETLNAAYENGSINVTSNYYSYIVLLFIVILLVFMLIRYSVPGLQSGGGMEKTHNLKNIWAFIFGIFTLVIVGLNLIIK